MFANAFQSGFISIFYSVGSAPLSIWNKEVKNGHIRRVVDEEVKSLVLEISGTNVATTYITCPQKPRVSLAIKLPFLVMIIKNMKKYFTFEIQILDDKDIRRRFRVSNFQSTTKVRPFCTTMPIGLSDGWNQVQFNLADFTKRAYGSTYLETVRVQVHANVRIRRIYFSDTLYSEDEMPNEFRLFLPTAGAKAKTKERGKIEKKQAPKAAIEEEVPSGAPPSPVEEIPAPVEEHEEGPMPTAHLLAEEDEGGQEAEEEAAVQERASVEVIPEGEEKVTQEVPPEGEQEFQAEPQAGGEVGTEDESKPEEELPHDEERETQPEEETAPPEETQEAEGTEEAHHEESPAEERPTEEAPATEG